MKKLVIISMVASPHQVHFVPYLAKYFDVHHYFYEQLGGRQEFWRVDLGERCHILPCKFTWHRKYVTLSVLKILRQHKPDILLLGGFSIPSNYFAYLWARFHHVPVAVFTERSRDSSGKLRGYGIVWRVLHWLYRNVSLVITTAPD
ncbi:MAG: glycosyltransferase, partial [Kiritimatiellae bacterium]|nr:glycosyltransferase [Kiritimatiellia bacterium]